MAAERIVLRPQADRDIDIQADYLAAERSVDMALYFLQSLENTLTNLVRHPKLGSARRFQDTRLEGVRVWPVPSFPNHLIFYTPHTGYIEVLRILHAARDAGSLLRM